MLDFSMVAGSTLDILIDVDTDFDLTAASDIIWTLTECCEETPLITKSKTGGGVTALTAGKIKVTLIPADTATLSGSYMHSAKVLAVGGQVYPIREEDDTKGEAKITK